MPGLAVADRIEEPPLAGRSPYHGQRMSLEEFEPLIDIVEPALEWWDGIVIQKDVGKRDHGLAQVRVAVRFEPYIERLGGNGWTEAHSWFEGRGYRVPDYAYWGPRKPQGTSQRSLPPTLAVEVRSEGQSMAAQRAKCRAMRDNGVDVCWLIDTQHRTLEVFETGRDGKVYRGDATVTSAHLPGFALGLPDLFAPLDRTAP